MRHLALSAVALLAARSGAAQRSHAAVAPLSPAEARSVALRQPLTKEARRRVIDYLDADAFKDERRWLDGKRVMGTTLFTSADDRTTYLLVRRAESSKPEVHARWDDLVIVRAGSGAIELGDSLVGSRIRAPGERVGGTIARSYRLVVRPGEIVRIPAAVPHAFIVSPETPLEYVVIKQRRPDLPIRWKVER